MTQPYLWETVKDLNRLAILFPEREAVGIDNMKEGKANRVRAPFLHFFLLAYNWCFLKLCKVIFQFLACFSIMQEHIKISSMKTIKNY